MTINISISLSQRYHYFDFTGPGPITLFAPDNAAFKKLPAGALDVLLKDKSKLTGT